MPARVKAHRRKGVFVKQHIRKVHAAHPSVAAYGVPAKLELPMHSEGEITATLKRLSSQHGGAWTYHMLPFSQPGDKATFTRHESPSKVPDRLFDITHGRIGYKGGVTPFTKAAIIREHNRGITGE